MSTKHSLDHIVIDDTVSSQHDGEVSPVKTNSDDNVFFGTDKNIASPEEDDRQNHNDFSPTSPPNEVNRSMPPTPSPLQQTAKGKMSSRWRKAVTAVTAARAFRTSTDLPTFTTAEKVQNLRLNLRRTMSRRPQIDDDDEVDAIPQTAISESNAEDLIEEVIPVNARTNTASDDHSPADQPHSSTFRPSSAATAHVRRQTVADVSRKSVRLEKTTSMLQTNSTVTQSIVEAYLATEENATANQVNIFSCVSCRKAITIEPFSIAHFVPSQIVPSANEQHAIESGSDHFNFMGSKYPGTLLRSTPVCVRYAEDAQNKALTTDNSFATEPSNKGRNLNPTLQWQNVIKSVEGIERGSINLTAIDSRLSAKTKSSTLPVHLSFWRKRHHVQVFEKSTGSDTQPRSMFPLLQSAPFVVPPVHFKDLQTSYKTRIGVLKTVGQPCIGNFRTNFGLAAQSILCDTSIGIEISGTKNQGTQQGTIMGTIAKVTEAIAPLVSQSGSLPAQIPEPQLTASQWAGQPTSHLPATAATVQIDANTGDIAVSRPVKATGFFATGNTLQTNAMPPFSSGFNVDCSITAEALKYDVAPTEVNLTQDGFHHAAINMSLLTRGKKCSMDLIKESPLATTMETKILESAHSRKLPSNNSSSTSYNNGTSNVSFTPMVAFKINASHRMQRKRLLALYETISEQAGGVDLPLCAACNAERSTSLQSAIASLRVKMQTLTDYLQSFDKLSNVNTINEPKSDTDKDNFGDAQAISMLLLGSGPNNNHAQNIAGEITAECCTNRMNQLDEEINDLHRELQALMIQEQAELEVTETIISRQHTIDVNKRKLESTISEGDRLMRETFAPIESMGNDYSLLKYAFRFNLEGTISTINDLRIGRLSTSFFQQTSELNAVSNEEINCGCGFLIQLAMFLAARHKITAFTKPIRLIYRGSQSVIESRTSSGKTETFDFFISNKLFTWNTFGNAWVSFASCVNDLFTFFERRVAEMKKSQPEIASKFKSVPSLPINNDTIGGYSIKYGTTSDDNWTIAVRHLMIILNWCVSIEHCV